MALPKDIFEIIKKLEQRIQTLERASQIKNITLPSGGKLVLDAESSDPPVQNGRMYYNTTSGKIRKCANGVWSDVG